MHIKIDIDQIAEIKEHHTEVEVSMDHFMSIIMEITIEKTILEISKITEVKVIEVDTEGIIEMIILEEVEVGLGIYKE